MIPVIPHTYDNNDDSECNVCGYQRNVNCDHSQTTVLDGKSATCTATGLTEGKQCSSCGEILIAQEIIAKLPHTEVIIPGMSPCCETNGLTEGKQCCYCGEITVAQNSIDALGHNYETVVTPPSCIVDGYTVYTCVTCSYSYTGDRTPAACNYQSTIVSPTCTGYGYTLYTCTECGQSYQEDQIDPIGHTEVLISGYPATCTTNGLSDGSYCSTCNMTINYQMTIYCTGHSYSDWVIDKEGCTSLEKLAIGKSLETVGENAFANCSSLARITFSGNIPVYDYSSFSNLNTVEFAYSVTSIYESAFADCTAIKTVIIGNSVTSISANAFNGCSSLEKLTLGRLVETIGENALANCSSLTGIEFNGTVEKWDTIVKAETWNSATGEYTINCSDGTISKDGTVTKTE